MINNTIEHLRVMNMSALAAELERQIADAESYDLLGFEDRLTLLVDAEWNRRQNNKLTRAERKRMYTPSRRSHLHGLSEPPYRTLRATFTE